MNSITTTTSNGEILEQSRLAVEDDHDDLGGGIRSSFPVISYRGAKWRLRYQGNEQLMVDERGIPVPEIAVCLVRVPKHLSKRFYIGGYPGEGQDRKPPDCWSNDGVRPDPSLTPPAQPDNRPLPTSCARCYFDGIGSMVSQDGKKKMKACADYKRVVVKLYYPQVSPELENMPILLTVPAASLQNLKAYGAQLDAHKVAALGRVTYIKLDDDVSYGKQQFRPGPALSDEELLNVRAMRQSEETAGILREEMIEGADPVEPGVIQADTVHSETVQAAPAPAPQSAPQATAQATQRAAQPAPTRSPLPSPGARPIAAGEPLQGVPAPLGVGAARGVHAAPLPAGRPVGSINQAVAKPAAPPASARVVQHPASVQSNVVEPEPEQEAEGDANDPIQSAMDNRFAELMGGKLKN